MENENYATKEFPLRIETMCVRNPFDAHNPIYHPYHNTSNFVSVEEFYERYKKDTQLYTLMYQLHIVKVIKFKSIDSLHDFHYLCCNN